MPDALAELRAATAAAHAQLESTLDIAAPGADSGTYLHYLQDLYGWLAPFDAALWGHGWPAALDAPSRAAKLAWIEADLTHAAMAPGAIAMLPRTAWRPDLSSTAARFGVAYVIEGAQLGTKELQRRLAGPLAGWQPRWLEGYGERNGSRWRAFLHALADQVQTRQEIDAACAAAKAAFAALAQWFDERRRARAALET